MVKDRQHLYDSFSNDADYLYQTDGDDLNLGKISIQCGRRNDALKFWAVWKAIGTKGLGKMVDHHFELANYALDYVRNHPDYTVYSYENSVNICFNYKDVDPKVLCNSLYEKGELMVGYGQFKDDTFVRLVAVNANNTKEDMDRFFEKMEAFVEQKLSQTAKS
jgi:sulfinoalanine decarboxylase/sulfinoalanine decarboxylase/aspartate 1-decarboxylase